MNSRVKLTILGAAAALSMLLAVAAGARTLTTQHHHSRIGTPRLSHADLHKETRSIPSSLRKRLRIFRATASASSTDSAQIAAPMAPGLANMVNTGGTRANTFGANPTLASGVNTAAGPVYAVPGSTGLCHVAPGIIGCGPVAELDDIGKLTTINFFVADDGSNPARVTGVVPDQVTGITIVMQDGSEQNVPITANLFGALVTSQMAEIDYTTNSGTVRQPIDYLPGTKIPTFR